MPRSNARVIDPLWWGTTGPHDAPIVIVGEAWGEQEEGAEAPFRGASGQELTRMLDEAGLDRNFCLVTNVYAGRPPQNEFFHYFHNAMEAKKEKRPVVGGLHPTNQVIEEVHRLYKQIHSYPRKLVIAVGNYALWALTDYTTSKASERTRGRKVPGGITTHRGSMSYMLNSRLDPSRGYSDIPLLPILHPAGIIRQWSQRNITVHDLAARVPMAINGNWRPNPYPEFIHEPSFDQIEQFFNEVLNKLNRSEKVRLPVDIETLRKSLISIIGFTDRPNFAISIPLIRRVEKEVYDSYWRPEIEAKITQLMFKVLMHPNILVEGQNFNYDRDYFLAEYGTVIPCSFDYMVAQGVIWPGLPKSLDFLASMYSDHYWYWKDDAKVGEEEGKEWSEKTTLEASLKYNCLDMWHSWNVGTALAQLVEEEEQQPQFEEQMWKFHWAFRMSNRGIPIDKQLRSKLTFALMESISNVQNWLETMVPQEVVTPELKTKTKTKWYNSAKQKKLVLGEILEIPIPVNYKSGTESLNKEALDELELKFPFWSPIFQALRVLGSLRTFHSTFMMNVLERNGTYKSSFKTPGTETLRLASGTNSFGRGGNLQNIPKGDGE